MPFIPVVRIKMVTDHKIRVEDKRFTCAEQVAEYAREVLDETDREHFLAMYLDNKNRIAGINVVSIGSINQSIVHPREVFKGAILANAAAVILVHNHPSGDPTPSQEDHNITKRLKASGDDLGIRVLDHIIVGDGCEKFLSFCECGLI